MPFELFNLASTAYLVFAVTMLLGVIVLIRLMLAATRALNAYTEDKKLRIALALDGVVPADGSTVP